MSVREDMNLLGEIAAQVTLFVVAALAPILCGVCLFALALLWGLR